jgi:lysophospholipase L1-like esterase
MRIDFRRMARAIAALGIGAILVGEVYCRQVLGLGDPPLYVPDPQIEYLLKPDQDVQRFGNRILVNHWGMRSENLAKRRADPNEVRVLVMGDSVINGGSQIDHEKLTTSLLQRKLQAGLGRPVAVANASAGSWGPGNWLAYVEKFGFFDADLVVLLVNSGDYADNPTFEPLDANHPTAKPLLALQEAVLRYLPGYLPSLLHEPPGPAATVSAADQARGLSDLGKFFSLANEQTHGLMVFHHPDQAELATGNYLTGHQEMQALAKRFAIPFTDLRPAYLHAGGSLYRDPIHHNLQGQSALADLLYEALLAKLLPTATSH